MTGDIPQQEPAIVAAIPLLLLPGLLCDEAVWTSQIAGLSTRASCTVVDYAGLASITDMARLAVASAPPGRFAVAGHSMGGRVALEVWRQAPERVCALALMDTGYQALEPGQAGDKEAQGRARLLAIAREHGMRALGEAWAPGMVHPDRVGDALFERILAMIGRKNPAIFDAQIKALLGRPDTTALLPTITCPTLLLCGRQDTWSPLARHEQMHAAIRHSTLVTIEDSGHMSTMEQPESVTAAMVHWLAQIRQ